MGPCPVTVVGEHCLTDPPKDYLILYGRARQSSPLKDQIINVFSLMIHMVLVTLNNTALAAKDKQR